MLFYEIRCGVNSTADGQAITEAGCKSCAADAPGACAEFNSGLSDAFCFAVDFVRSDPKKGRMPLCAADGTPYTMVVTLGYLAKSAGEEQSAATAFLSRMGLLADAIAVTEVTFRQMTKALRTACGRDYIADEDAVLGQLGLGSCCRLSEDCLEQLIAPRSREELTAAAGKSCLSQSLLAEFARICGGRQQEPRLPGHPVHYMVRTFDRELEIRTVRLLLEMLSANGRLASRRLTVLNLDMDGWNSDTALQNCYRLCGGSTLAVRLIPSELGGGSTARRLTELLCRLTAAHRNEVLTVICLPQDAGQLRDDLLGRLGKIPVVELQEDMRAGADAKRFLQSETDPCCLDRDESLFEGLKGDQPYPSSALRGMAGDWYARQLQTVVYPQYRQIAREEPGAGRPAYEELQEMIGLPDVKRQMDVILSYYRLRERYREKGMDTGTPGLHMVFSGNPGTAKTTVARLYARILKENGILASGQLVEVGRSDLVDRFVGWTARTTKDIFAKAKGGVLFIDEAYSLMDDRRGCYGDEALNTIVQEMENHREEVVVIFAGYPDLMEEFLQRNPGLSSRIGFHIRFADYDSAELCAIAELMGKKQGMRFCREAMQRLEEICSAARQQSGFGNGRFVRNLVEQAKMNLAARLTAGNPASLSAEELCTITAEDVMLPAGLSPVRQQRPMGFC